MLLDQWGMVYYTATDEPRPYRKCFVPALAATNIVMWLLQSTMWVLFYLATKNDFTSLPCLPSARYCYKTCIFIHCNGTIVIIFVDPGKFFIRYTQTSKYYIVGTFLYLILFGVYCHWTWLWLVLKFKPFLLYITYAILFLFLF